eukprot:scaffold11538_cov122-Isochrysis_galbana.AAC.1
MTLTQLQRQRYINRGKPQLGRWAFYWEGVFGAAQNVGRFWCRHPARLLWASGGHPRGQSRLIWVRQGPWVPYVEQAGRPAPGLSDTHTAASQKIAVEFSKSQTNIAVEFPFWEVATSDELHNEQSNLNDLSRKK